MSTNLGTILVGLGYDLSALEKGAPEAFRLINQQTLGMSAEMKRASREGAESFRLIDEALGIHVSRPLVRILTQEFPGFAKVLQSVLGVGLLGAVGAVAFEVFDKIAKGIENAQKAQEAFAAATEKTGVVFSDAMDAYAKAEKMRSLSGLGLELFKINSTSIEQAKKQVDELTASFAELIKKQQAAEGFFTKIEASIGNAAHVLYNTPTELAAERLGKQIDTFKTKYDELSKIDALKGTNESAKYVNDQLATAQVLLQTMSSRRMTGFETFMRNQLPITQTGQFCYSDAEISRMQQIVEMLTKVGQLKQAGATDKGGKDDDVRRAAALEAQHEAIKELQGDLKGWNDEANKGWEAWIKINAEIDKALAHLGDNALPESAKRFQEASKVFFPAISQVGPPPGAPQLADQAELEKVITDQNEAWKKAGEILAQIETPLQKYNTQLAILKQLMNGPDGPRISTAQFAQAQQNLQEQLAQAEQRMEKLLKEGGAAGGMKAFMMQLQGEGTKGAAGQFTFDLLNKGLEGFEDETVKALTGAKANWASFFESLDQMALKFMLNGLISQVLKGFSSNSSGGGGFGGIGAFIRSLFGGAAGGGASNAADVPGMFASGTDFAPGGLAWVGEQGPELVNLPRGSSVTPNSALRGNNSVTVHIDARGGEIGVEDKIARAISASAPQIIMRAVVEASEVQRRTPR